MSHPENRTISGSSGVTVQPRQRGRKVGFFFATVQGLKEKHVN
jgi:hypothetical protein